MQRIKLVGAQQNSRTILLCTISKIQAAQDDAGRSTFEFLCKKLSSSTLINLITQPHELRFALVRLGPLQLF
jgi:hypothetical protein